MYWPVRIEARLGEQSEVVTKAFFRGTLGHGQERIRVKWQRLGQWREPRATEDPPGSTREQCCRDGPGCPDEAWHDRRRAHEAQRRRPQPGAGGERWGARRELHRGAGNDEGLRRQEHQKSCRHQLAATAQVMDGEQRAGDDERDTIDRPRQTTKLCCWRE